MKYYVIDLGIPYYIHSDTGISSSSHSVPKLFLSKEESEIELSNIHSLLKSKASIKEIEIFKE